MLRRVHRAADGPNVVRDAGRGLVLDDQYTLDLVLFVFGEEVLDPLDRRALAPLHVEDVHAQAVPLREVDPQVAELAQAHRDDPVPRRQRVDERRFPAAGACRGKDERLSGGGLEDLLQVA